MSANRTAGTEPGALIQSHDNVIFPSIGHDERRGWTGAGRFAPVRRRCQGIAALLGWAVALLAGGPSADQRVLAADNVVSQVRFEGLGRTTEAFVQSIVRTRAGQVFDAAVADGDVTRLLATRRFSSAHYDAKPTPGGVEVTFRLAEFPSVTEITFSGNVKFSDKKLRKQVEIETGSPVDTFAARQGAEAILQMYRDAGYGQAAVRFDDATLRESGRLAYQIEEGPLVRVRQISFEGNEHIPKTELLKHVTTKTYLWVFRDGKFDRDVVQNDAAAIQNYYRGQGYLDCRVSYRVDTPLDPKKLHLTFVIAEGSRYNVESIDFRGNEVYSDEELRATLTLEVGGPMLASRLDADVKAIQARYTSRGYIFAQVRPVRVFSDEPGLVQVTFDIEENSRYDVGRIVVRGNERTRDKVVRRQLELFPGEVFDLSKAESSERNLRATRLFESASVTPVGDQADVRDVLVTVQESRKAGDFNFGFGVTSNSGLVGSVVLDFNNFDLFRPPRNFAEFIKLRSFYGGGQRLRLEAQPGASLSRFRVDFTEPFLFDKKLRFDMGVYYFERGRVEFDERRAGGNVAFGRRLKWEPLKDWYGELALRVEEVNVDGLDIFTARRIRDDDGSTTLTSVKASLVRDHTDQRFIPTSGDRIRVSYEQFGVLGGDAFFGKLLASYTWYKTLFRDEMERPHVISAKGSLGGIVGDPPVFERFYAGGIGSIRGFRFRGVSPRQGLDDDAVGGDFMLLLSSEYSFPLYGENLRGLVFTDMGTVEDNYEITQWRASIGGGVRLHLDFFGPVPLEFDIAVPVLRDADDRDQVFSFFIGATF